MTEQAAVNYADTTVTYHETVEESHGRIETRRVTVCADIDWLKARHNWPGLKSIVMVQYHAILRDKTRAETRFYISSMTSDARQHAKAMRAGDFSKWNGPHSASALSGRCFEQIMNDL